MLSAKKSKVSSIHNRFLLGVIFVITAAIAYPRASAATSKPKITVALWVANGTDVLEFDPGDFIKGVHTSAPHLKLNSAAGFGAPQGVVFDTSKDLWVIDGGTTSTGGSVVPALDEFTFGQLGLLNSLKKANRTPVPHVALTSTAFIFPQQAVFDSSGNLCVSDNGANAVYVFTTAQLAAGGSQDPTVTITANPAFSGPLGIAFSSTGNLWIANNASTTIYEFNSGDLPPPTTPATVSLVPNVILSDDGVVNNGSIQNPWALVFDSTGNLWSSNANPPNTVVEFAKAVLTTTGDPVPAVTLSPAMEKHGAATLAAPNGIAFDNLGDLAAISSASPFGAALFIASQLAAGGAVLPNTLLFGKTTTLNAPAGCNFGPFVNK